MQFFTKVPISETQKPIDYDSKIVSIGSCFAENIGQKLAFYKFNNTTNPFGIIFNPISLENSIERTLQKNYFSEKDLIFHNQLWHCFEVHSQFSDADKDLLLKKLNANLDSFYQELTTSTHFIITLGTSWVYKTVAFNEIVANCHKIPQKEFTKQLLSVAEISKALKAIVDLVLKVNPQCQCIFTISPVRHIKDGFFENQVSKSHLISAVFDLIKNSNISYFPSYEIMMDELRDYRFYSQDLLHPNTTAVDYIWSRFVETTMTQKSLSVMKEIENIQKSLAHRPFNVESSSHQEFLQKLYSKIEKLRSEYPHLTF